MSADLLQRLMEAGTPMALIAEVAERLADASAAERILAKRRTADRERKPVANPRIPRNSTEETENAEILGAAPSPQSPPLKSPPDPQKITPPLTPQPRIVGARAIPKFDSPEGVTAEQFKAFRQQRKKPLNAHSYDLLCRKLKTLAEAGWPPGEMIDLAIERGWETVFEPKDQRRNGYHADHRDPTTVALELLEAQDRAREDAQAGGPDLNVGGGSGSMDHSRH